MLFMALFWLALIVGGVLMEQALQEWEPIIQSVLLPFIERCDERFMQTLDYPIDSNREMLQRALDFYWDHAVRFGVDKETWHPLTEQRMEEALCGMKQALGQTHAAYQAYESLPKKEA